MRNREGLQDVQRVNGIETPFVDIVPGGVVSPQNRVASSESQVLGCTILEGVGNLVEDFALGRLALATIECRVDVIATQVCGFPSQPRYTVSAKVQLVAGLPGPLVFEVEVREEGAGYPNAAATVAIVVQIAGVARNALAREDKGMRADGILGRKTLNSVVIGISDDFNIICFVVVEIECQRLIFSQVHHIVDVGVLLVVSVFDVGEVQ